MAEKTVIEITGAFAPETVESIHELLMERMATLGITDFTVEIRQTSDEELVEEAAQLSEIGMSAESAEDTVQRMFDEQADRMNGEEMADFSIFGIEEELRNIGEEL